MIFLVFIILTILGIGIISAEYIIIEKYDYKGDNGKLFSFVWNNDEAIGIIGGIVAVVSGIITLIMLISIVIAQVSADGNRTMMEQRYKALICKSQAESVKDEYIDEIQKWNEDLAKKQSYSHNIWIGIFYPKKIYEGLEVIDLENIKIKD